MIIAYGAGITGVYTYVTEKASKKRRAKHYFPGLAGRTGKLRTESPYFGGGKAQPKGAKIWLFLNAAPNAWENARLPMLVTSRPFVVLGIVTAPPEPVYPVMVMVPLLVV